MAWWPFSDRSGETPASGTDFVVFDLEMGGLSPGRDDIVSMGAVRMRGGRIDLGSPYEVLVRPFSGCSSTGSVLVHQLTPAELEQGTCLSEALPAFLRYCGGAVLAGWHVELDMAFLRAAAARLGMPAPKNRALDVLGLALAIRAIPGERGAPELADLPLKDVTLYSVARALDVPPRGGHSAIGDAFVTAQVLQRFLSILRVSRDGREPDLGALLKLSRPRPEARQGF